MKKRVCQWSEGATRAGCVIGWECELRQEGRRDVQVNNASDIYIKRANARTMCASSWPPSHHGRLGFLPPGNSLATDHCHQLGAAASSDRRIS